MSQQSSFIANPLNDSQAEQFSRIEQLEIAQTDQVDEKDSPQNPLESESEVNSNHESEVLNHYIGEPDQENSESSDDPVNPMLEQDPTSLDRGVHEKLAQIGQQYHQCQTVVDCDKSLDNQIQNPLYSCEDFQQSKNQINDSKQDQLKQLEQQIQDCQKRNLELENQVKYIQRHTAEQISQKQKEISEMQLQNGKLQNENKLLKDLLSQQQKEITELQKLIKDSDSELLTQQRSKTGAESQKGHFFQESKGQQSLNDQTLQQQLTPQNKNLKKIPSLSIETTCPFSVRNRPENTNNQVAKHIKTELISERKRATNQPKSSETLQELIRKAQIVNQFQKSKNNNLLKVNGTGQIFCKTPTRIENDKKILTIQTKEIQ